MKKIVRLTESDLVRIVKRVVSEQSSKKNYFEVGEMIKLPIKSKPGTYVSVKITKLVENEPGNYTQDYIVIDSNHSKQPKGSKGHFETDYANTYTLYTPEGREYQSGKIQDLIKL